MAMETHKPSRIFTVAEANARLPLIRAITRDLVRLAREVVERHQRVEHLKAGRAMSSGDPYDEELAQIEDELAKDRRRLHEFVEELRELGVEPKGSLEGLVDFPAMLDGRLVYLCWQFDEPEVAFWHELDAGFRGRQPLAIAAVGDCPS